jgi:ubiquinone/menaquinone biosynthesis C-methylase UbiE
MAGTREYIPALSIAGLTKYYDAAMATIFQERRYRMPLVAALDVKAGERVLDVGCGTGTLTLLLAQHTPAGLVAGIDIDPQMLVAAQGKTAGQEDRITVQAGSAAVLPYADATFAWVVSSLMFHHLPTPRKLAMLREVHRVLTPGGRLALLDFGPVGQGAVAEAAAALLGGFEEAGDNLAGRVPLFMRAEGFVNVRVHDVAFGGVIKLYAGSKPA